MAERKIKVTLVGDSSSLSRALSGVNANAGKLGSKLGGVFKGIAKGGAVALAGLGVIVGKTGIEFDSMRQQAQIAFTTMLGSGKKAKNFLDELQSFAAKTPFEFADVTRASQRLLAMGFTSKEVLPELTAIGDAVAGLGGSAELVNQVTTAIGQMKAKGKASAEEMLQLTEAGIPAWQFLADKIGKTVPEAMALVTKRAISSEVAISAVTDGMERKFGGLMDKQSHSLAGLWSTFKDTFSMISGQVMAPFFRLATAGLEKVNAFLGKISQAKGLRAKIAVVWDTAKTGAFTLTAAVGGAISAIDWDAAWSRARGIGAGLQARIEAIDWGKVGGSIGTGISTGVSTAISKTKGLPTAILKTADSIDWNQLGRKMGPGLAAAMVTALATLLDPAFWVKNWDLALAIGLTVFSGAVGKVAGKFGSVLVREMTPALMSILGAFDRMAGRVALWIAEWSPRLAMLFLRALGRLPGLASDALGALVGVVAKVFGKLGGLAQFVLKVLGIREAIRAVVGFGETVAHALSTAWDTVKNVTSRFFRWIEEQAIKVALKVLEPFSHLPAGFGGWARDLKSSLQAQLADLEADGSRRAAAAGNAIGRGLVYGITSQISAASTQIAGAVAGAVLAGTNTAGRRLHGSGDWMFTKHAVGEPMAQGIIDGFRGRIKALTGEMSAVQGEISRAQARIDAEQRRQEDADNTRALVDAQKAVATARKKGEGLLEAQRQLDDARQAIADTAAQREVDAAQRKYDRLQKAYEKAQAKFAAATQRAQTNLSRIQSIVSSAFSAKSSGWVSPAQAAINAINDRRSQEDLEQAVTDAQKTLADAMSGGDPSEILGAQRALARAQEDIQLATLQKQAAEQQAAHDKLVSAQQDAMDQAFQKLSASIDKNGGLTKNSLRTLLRTVKSYAGDWADVGSTLGDYFGNALRGSLKNLGATITVTASAGGKVAVVGKAPMLDSGGFVSQTGLAVVHRGEMWSGVPTRPGWGGGGHVIVNVHAGTVVGANGMQELALRVKSELTRDLRRGGTPIGARP